MQPCNQSFTQSFPSNGTCLEEVPLFVTYLFLAVILIVGIVVIIPAVMVINVIWWTTELHTKYYFFVANLLATDIITVIVRTVIQYLIVILYLLDLNSDSAGFVLKYFVFLLFPLTTLITVLLPITVAVERYDCHCISLLSQKHLDYQKSCRCTGSNVGIITDPVNNHYHHCPC